ncbi:Isochorismatase hydrolase [Gaertneriomyces semiglobifer]|nr:Isochorismatase hydrolase [Gaertneriomyces semiglobifer]
MASAYVRATSNAGRRLHMQLKPESTAFLLCDIQERFRGLIWKYSHVIDTASKMVAASKLLDIPVIGTEQHPKGLGHTVQELTSILPPSAAMFPKTRFSMAIPPVNELLANKQNIVLFGIESHVCVLQSALDFMDAGHDVYVLADGVSSMNRGEVPIALDRMREAGVRVATSESILFQLMGDSADPRFKGLSKLVKEYQEKTKDAVDTLVSANL